MACTQRLHKLGWGSGEPAGFGQDNDDVKKILSECFEKHVKIVHTVRDTIAGNAKNLHNSLNPTSHGPSFAQVPCRCDIMPRRRLTTSVVVACCVQCRHRKVRLCVLSSAPLARPQCRSQADRCAAQLSPRLLQQNNSLQAATDCGLYPLRPRPTTQPSRVRRFPRLRLEVIGCRALVPTRVDSPRVCAQSRSDPCGDPANLSPSRRVCSRIRTTCSLSLVVTEALRGRAHTSRSRPPHLHPRELPPNLRIFDSSFQILGARARVYLVTLRMPPLALARPITSVFGRDPRGSVLLCCNVPYLSILSPPLVPLTV